MDSFFKAGRVYGVIGASKNPVKYGNKVLKWYKDRNLTVTPVNPNDAEVLGLPAVSSVQNIKTSPGQDLALSVVTPPAGTLELMHSLPSNVAAIWMQPGSWTPEVVREARKHVPNVITDCILVKGDRYLSKL